jgi:polar amino acid transport system substrate-binding protein
MKGWSRWVCGLVCCVLVACASAPPISPALLSASAVASPVALPPVSAAVVSALAPTGVLRVGVYPGSPTSWVRLPGSGESAGVAFDLGHALATRLAVPVKVMEYPRVADIVDALQRQEVDFTFTNASAARARVVDFSTPLIRLELGLLVGPRSSVESFNQVDQVGLRVGVTQGSSSQAVLRQRFKHAEVVPVVSLAAARQGLQSGELDVFATNKGILFEMKQQLPGFRVLEDRWGLEQLAMAIPQGRTSGLSFLQNWVNHELPPGTVAHMASRAGLQGMAKD